MSESPSLIAAIKQYQLRISGVQFWVPYWINLAEAPYYLDAPLRGKGSGSQLGAQLKQGIASGISSPKDAGAMRALMRDLGLGVDCSGFVFHVMTSWLRLYRINLSDRLFIDRSEVEAYIEASRDRYPERRELLPGVLPEAISLTELCRAWSKEPADIVSAGRLVHPRNVVEVPQAGLIMPGDLIKTSSDFGDHIAVVSGVSSRTVTFYSSDENEEGLGGVTRHTVTIDQPRASIADQAAMANDSVTSDSDRNGVWRLNVIDAMA
jgi:hypothetical protein